MTSTPDVSLEPATARDAPLLANLLELYVHDLSAVFPSVTLGPDGRFGYPTLPLYWEEPERRFAFVIRCAGAVAGFAFAARGEPLAIDPEAMDVAEFFVLRRYRRTRVGQRAATLLWNRFPGRWTVRVAARNRTGLAFWRAVVAEAAGFPLPSSTYVTGATEWHLFAFEPKAPPPAG